MWRLIEKNNELSFYGSVCVPAARAVISVVETKLFNPVPIPVPTSEKFRFRFRLHNTAWWWWYIMLFFRCGCHNTVELRRYTNIFPTVSQQKQAPPKNGTVQ